MNFKAKFFILILSLIIVGMGCVSASGIDDNVTASQDISIGSFDNSYMDELGAVDFEKQYNESYVVKSNDVQDSLKATESNGVIVVNNWDELQYYCSLKDDDYTLKLKENTSFYPTDPSDSNYQIKVHNKVRIIGSEGSYIGYNSSNAPAIGYAAIIVPDGYKSGITMENVEFKWISVRYGPDGVFLQMAGRRHNTFKNCRFSYISTNTGHSSILYLKKGTATLDNCSFIKCTTDYGVVSVYDPNSVKSTDMTIRNCYFEGNYARTEPGCINNCGKLTVYNTTFVKNRSFWWAGAIHTHNYGNTTIYDSNFTDNEAGWNGGALYTYSYLQIYNTIFIGNNCTTNSGGGAIGACAFQSNPHIYIENCLFEKNRNNCWSTDQLSNDIGAGGAIALMDEGSIVVLNSSFISNAAAKGCAISACAAGEYGSPNVIIANNSFINHTQTEALRVSVEGSTAVIEGNYYEGNRVEFSNLVLSEVSSTKDYATLQVDVGLANPQFYDSDILSRMHYAVYVNDEYVKTVDSNIFTVDFDSFLMGDVYVVPTISNSRSNVVSIASFGSFIYVSKSSGDDNNNGTLRESPVKTIKKALELAPEGYSIVILDGVYDEGNFQINRDLTIIGGVNATLTNNTSFTVNANNFALKNIRAYNLISDTFIKQSNGNLDISNCIFDNNSGLRLIDADNVNIVKSIFTNNNVIVYNNAFATVKNSVLLNNSKIVENNLNSVDLDYNWWGNTLNDISKPADLNINNWLVLNATSSANVLEYGQSSNIQFNCYVIENNRITKYSDLVKFNLEISAINGSVNKNLANYNSNVRYTQTASGNGVVTAGYNDVSFDLYFDFVKFNPDLSIKASDIMFGQSLEVTILGPGDISESRGSYKVSVGGKSLTKLTRFNTFKFDGLSAGDYEITLEFSGNEKYAGKTVTSKVSVNKYSTTTKITTGNVEVGSDLMLTITTSKNTVGNVTLSINDIAETLILNNNQATYTINGISRGDYYITAVYNGNERYAVSQDSILLEVDNMEPDMSVSIENSIYGEPGIVEVTLNPNAGGRVTASVEGITNSSEVVNGHAEIVVYGVNAGNNHEVSVFYNGDGIYFNKTAATYMNVSRANFTFVMNSEDIYMGHDEVITIVAPPKTIGTFTIEGKVLPIPMSGEVSYTLKDLEVGNYTVSAVFNSDNYNTVSNSTSFEVKEFDSPQWGCDGSSTQNTQKSDYAGDCNGDISWTAKTNSAIVSNIVIDSQGNVYVACVDGIYSYDCTGNLRWIYSSDGRMGNFTGLAFGHDVVVSPRAGDTLYFVNQNGSKYGYSNIYQASSLFAPIIDGDANVFTVSEYQYESSSYNLVITPYALWENGGDPVLISLGNFKPIASPSVSEDIYAVIGMTGIMVIDAHNHNIILSKTGNFKNVRPVIGDGNIVYAILGDAVVAYAVDGSQLNRLKIAGGVGDNLLIDNDLGVYLTNGKGNLYRCDMFAGEQTLICDLCITSGILIDEDHNLYFASNDTFYGIDSQGNVLWKSDLDSKIIGKPVMDKNGLIYVATEDGIVAIANAPLKDSNLKVVVEGIVEGEKATVAITWNNQATGTVSCRVNGEEVRVNAEDGKITKVISGLDVGYYDVNVSYSGDMRFKPASLIKTFVVRSIDDVANNIKFDGNSTFSFALNDAGGNLTVYIANQSYSKVLVNGQASITVNGLNPGDYRAFVVYSGDGAYDSANRTFDVSVPKFNVPLNETITVENVVFTVSVALPGDASGNLTLSIGSKKYMEKIAKGKATIVVDDMPAGKYMATLTYSGDSKYETVSKSVSINTTRIPVILDDSNVFVESGPEPVISIKLDADATGKFVVYVGGEGYAADISDNIVISDLEPGNYTGTVTYNGDGKYGNASYAIHFEVPKIIREFNETTLSFQKQDNNVKLTITLTADATGDIIVFVKDKNYTKTLTNGQAVIEVNNLDKGNYELIVSYTGDDKYASISKTIRFYISMINVTLDDTNLLVDNLTVSIRLNSDAEGNLTVIVNNKEFKEVLTKGSATLTVSGLSPGNYTATVVYSGDDKYSIADVTVSLTVPKITSNLDNLIIKSGSISIDFGNDATGTLTVNIDGKGYSAKVTDGISEVNIAGLDPGNYTAIVTYSGDNNYTGASTTIDFEVSRIKTVLDDNTLIVDSNSSAYSILLPNDATGTLTVTVDGTDYASQLVNGKATVNVPELSEGTHNITVAYSGDSKYEAITKSSVVNVNKTDVTNTTGDNGTAVVNSTTAKSDVTIIVAAGDVNVGEDALIQVTSSEDSIKLTVLVNNKQYALGGDGTVTISNLAVGKYNVIVMFAGDDKFNSASNSTTFNVIKISVPVTDETITLPDSNSTSYSVNLPADATGTLTVTVDGEKYTETLIDGKATVNIPELSEGAHNITVTYSGDSKYGAITKSSIVNVKKTDITNTTGDNSTVIDNTTNTTTDNGTAIDNSTNTTIDNGTAIDNTTNTTVEKVDPTLIVSASDVNVGDDAIINVKASFESGKVSVNVNGKDYQLIISNGEASASISDLAVGNYTVLARFAGDDKLNPASNSTSFNVLKVNVPVTDETVTVPSDDSTTYSISLPSDATGTLTVTVDGVNYTETLVNGEATVNIPELTEGSHNITVTYSGDAKYSPITKSSVVVKEHVPVVKLTGSNLNMLYTSGKYFKVRLTADGEPLAGQTVKITINGKTYSKTTNKDGYASIKIKLAPKTYTVKATYANLTITKKVTVKSIITAKNVNAKKSAKSVKIKVTLKKVNKKYLKNKKVTLKFNKKTIKAKTNKKGIVTFTIKKNVYKKLKTNKKYTYQVIYNKDKVKKTIKFK